MTVNLKKGKNAFLSKVAADGGRSERQKEVYSLQGKGGGAGSNETSGECAER